MKKFRSVPSDPISQRIYFSPFYSVLKHKPEMCIQLNDIIFLFWFDVIYLLFLLVI